MTRRRLVLVLVLAVGVVGAACGVTYAAFTATTSNPASSFAAKRIFPAVRSTSAWKLEDAADGSLADNSAPMAFAGDGHTYTSSAWTTTFSSLRYIDIDFNGSLPAGLPVSGVKFNFDFASNGGTTGCVYFEVRRASTNTVLGTFGSTSSPVACNGTTLAASSTDISSVVGTTNVANDLRIRVYGKETNSKGFKIDRATISGAGYASFTLYRTRMDDSANGTSTVTWWQIAQTGEGAQYQNDGNWQNTYSATRYLRFTFPGYLPANAIVTSATFEYTYKSQNVLDTTCYYFEVYSGGTLLATHGSSSSDVDCNATTSFETISTALPEVDTVAEANSVVVKLFTKNSGDRPTLTDGALLKVNYELAPGSGCADVGGSTTLQAVGDSFVQQDNANGNLGTSNNLDVKTQAGALRRPLVTFDLPTIPSGCSVTSATLRGHLKTTGGARTINAYRVNSSWTEAGVTWNTQPTTTGTPAAATTGAVGTWTQWDVTSAVQAIYGGTNYGFMLQDSAEGAGNITNSYDSRETTSKPELVLGWG